MTRHGKFSYLLFALLGLPAVGWAEEAVVLAVRPEGAVVDVGQTPDIQRGSRLGFVHLNGDRKETGQGWVLDVREGRALVGLTPGSAVKKGSRAILCPKPGEADPYQELRTMVDQLRNQAAKPGAQMRAEIQAMTNQVQLALEARDAALQQGACDMAEYDRQISALATDLQNLSARLQPVAMGSPPQEGSPPGTPSMETPPLQEPIAPGTPPMEASPQGGVDMISKMSEILQALGSKFGTGGGGESGGGAAPPASSGWTEPSSSSGATPGLDPGIPGGTSESATPPAPQQSATVQGKVRGEGGKAVAGAQVTAAEWNQTITTAPDGTYYLQGLGGQVTITAKASGYQEGSLVTNVAPGATTTRNILLKKEAKAQDPTKPPVKVIDPSKLQVKPTIPIPPQTKEEAQKDKPWWKGPAPVGQPSPEAKTPWWQVSKIQPTTPSTPSTPGEPQAVTPQKEIFKPGIGPMAKVTPGQIKLASVTGKVLNEKGQPVPGAKVAVGGAGSVLTNSQGKFTVQNLKPGKHEVVATAPGYKAETRKVTLEPGEDETVEFTLKKMAASPEKPLYKPMSPLPGKIPGQ
jgi:hypothetical protein